MTQATENFTEAGRYLNTPYILVGHNKDGSRDIRIHNLTVRTPEENPRTLVENLNLILPAGSRTVLTGASGSGKTLTAKAILGQYDTGSGFITMPDGVKIMSISQQAFFPNINLRGIMNAKTAGNETYRDEGLSAALHEVGLDNLIQQIPGQRIKVVLDKVLIEAARIVEENSKKTPDILIGALAKLPELAARISAKDVGTVQFTPDDYRQYFVHELTRTLNQSLRWDISSPQIKSLGDSVVDAIDLELTKPLSDFLKSTLIRETTHSLGTIPSRIHGSVKGLTNFFRMYAAQKRDDLSAESSSGLNKAFSRAVTMLDDHILARIDTAMSKENKISHYSAWGHFIPFTMGKLLFLEGHMERILNKRLAKYIANKDTDNQSREIRINAMQARHIAKKVSDDLGYHLSQNSTLSMTGTLASGITWPASAPSLYRKAIRLSRDATQALTTYMDHHILRGENIKLSGGERQKLMIATVLLHKPDILILDEITAALDRPTAVALYQEMMDKIPPGTTVLSIAHNEHIIPLHTHHAHLDKDNKTITLKKLTPPEPESPGLTI